MVLSIVLTVGAVLANVDSVDVAYVLQLPLIRMCQHMRTFIPLTFRRSVLKFDILYAMMMIFCMLDICIGPMVSEIQKS